MADSVETAFPYHRARRTDIYSYAIIREISTKLEELTRMVHLGECKAERMSF